MLEGRIVKTILNECIDKLSNLECDFELENRYIKWSKLDIEIYKCLEDQEYLKTSSKWINKVITSEKLSSNKTGEILEIRKMINRLNQN
ncbi:hypothetical protein MmarC5_0919 [Methanococcus maripaludis C5]|uniref:Uncharacterized protein n=1 Tax=Methanococcus maripaludis (strain C5 / ATCC BAA-1333) TaxID=402880 RepID=A4FYE1_METM5|nr:hypothetical protein MmarC5_0919 [Methanococcus maripaludis C5]